MPDLKRRMIEARVAPCRPPQRMLPDTGPASAQDFSPQSQKQSQTFATAYRGIVCEKRQAAADILRVPIDLAVHDNQVFYARPLFDPNGMRVLGSEIGTGSVDSNGKLHLTATWNFRGLVTQADYSGSLTPSGGTLTGTQSWRGPGDNSGSGSRACHIALVAASERTYHEELEACFDPSAFELATFA